MAYLVLINYIHLWKNEAKDDEIKEMKYRSQKQEYESLESLKKDSEYLEKKKKLIKRKYHDISLKFF